MLADSKPVLLCFGTIQTLLGATADFSPKSLKV